MRPEFEALKTDAERLSDGPDKKAMLEMLTQTTQLDAQTERELKQFNTRQRRSRILERLGGLLFFCVLGYFLVTGIYSGTMPNLFLESAPYVYWEHDPLVFSFIAAFFGLAEFSFLCMTLGVVSIGRMTLPLRLSRKEMDDRIQRELVLLEKENETFPVVTTFFGVKLRSYRIPAWFAVLVVGFLIVGIVNGIVSGQ